MSVLGSHQPEPARPQRGTTLIELVVVLTVVGVIASIGAIMVASAVQGQQDTRGRLDLALSVDGALARMNDELQVALPNSLRVTNNAAGVWIEWIPVTDTARYRQAPDTTATGPGDMLDVDNASDASFDVIGIPLATPPAGSQLVFYNLGNSDADAYLGNNRRSGLAVSNGGRTVSFTPTGQKLPANNDAARFYVVSPPLTLACVPAATAGFYELRRYSGYGWLASQPVSTTTLTNAGATSALVVGSLKSCSAAYSAALANIGLLTLRLQAGDTGSAAKMDFLQQLAVDNTP